MRPVRLAICQIESHPAIYASHLAYLEEPFLAGDKASLSLLAAKGMDVGQAQETCLRIYTSWQRARIRAIAAFLSSLKPVPDLVIFPEGAVPIDALWSLHEFAVMTGATVLAGTHTPRGTAQAKKMYEAIGVNREKQQKTAKYGKIGVLPVVQPSGVTLIPKRLASPFEQSIVSAPEPGLPSLRSLKLRTQVGEIDLLALICSEALRDHKTHKAPELVAIVSFDTKPDQFSGPISHHVRNKRFVAYCNDGRHGGSRIGAPRDERVPDWLVDTFPAGLPPGDTMLVVDINLDAPAVQVGTANPEPSVRLIQLGNIVAAKGDRAAWRRSMETIRKTPDSSIRAHELR